MEVVLKENAFAGDKVPRDRFPRKYVEKYGINNLYKYNLPSNYRACYTLLNDSAMGFSVIILEIMTHKEYDVLFGYRTT